MTHTFTSLQAAGLKKLLSEMGFEYQRRWYTPQKKVRHITKTRQCGADWYFSLEALIDAIETGRNQNFLAPYVSHSLSCNRERIVHFASQVGVNIEPGDFPIKLSNGAEIRFFDDHSYFAAFHGNAYVSEYAWADNPAKLVLAGKALSAHSKYRFTAYTTPSNNYEAFKIWQGEKPENKQRLSAINAIRQGCTLLELSDIKNEYSDEEFALLFSAVWPQEVNEVCK